MLLRMARPDNEETRLTGSRGISIRTSQTWYLVDISGSSITFSVPQKKGMRLLTLR